MQEFEIVLNVPMSCQHCVDSIMKVLKPVKQISSFDINLESKIVTTKGSLPPSEIVKIIQATGKDAIIRGTGEPNSAGVCILESYDDKDFESPVKGLARLVNVNSTEMFIDLTVNGLPKGTYYPLIRRSGNLSNGALSTGASFYELDPLDVNSPASSSTTIKSIGAATVDESDNLYSGQAFLYAKLNVKDLIGRSIILSKLKDQISPDSVCGVIARSAGAWENDKKICSCSGKTVWEERKDALSKGLQG